MLRLPLMRTGRALGQLPFVAEQVPEEVVAPLRRRRGPDDFQAAADRVIAFAAAKAVLPAQPLLLDGSAFRLGADILDRICGAVGLAERMSAGDERDGLLVVHGHAHECLANIPRRSDRIRLAIWSFRIDVDQTHLHGGERVLKIAVAAVALVLQPLAFGSPVNVLFGFPDVSAPAAKAESLEAHRLEGDVARENHQIGPRDFVAVFLLDRP